MSPPFSTTCVIASLVVLAHSQDTQRRLNSSVLSMDVCDEYPDPASCNSDPFCLYSDTDATCKACPFDGNTCFANSNCCAGAACVEGECRACVHASSEHSCNACEGYHWDGSACRVQEMIIFGSSDSDSKCVTLYDGLECAADAGNKGKKANTDNADANDAFSISVDGAKVCAKRTDTDGGWGQLLAIWCHLQVCDQKTTQPACNSCMGYYWTGSTCKPQEKVTIGPSDDNTKCAPSLDTLTCDKNGGNRGNRANTDSWDAEDAFEITASGHTVCAKRTDAGGGWGQHLAVWCDSVGALADALV